MIDPLPPERRRPELVRSLTQRNQPLTRVQLGDEVDDLAADSSAPVVIVNWSIAFTLWKIAFTLWRLAFILWRLAFILWNGEWGLLIQV